MHPTFSALSIITFPFQSSFHVVNVKLCLFLIKYSTTKTNGGMEVYLHAFLTSELDGCEWSASLTDLFPPRERVPTTHWIECCMGSRAGLDAATKRKKSLPLRELKPGLPARNLVTILTELNQEETCVRQNFDRKKWDFTL